MKAFLAIDSSASAAFASSFSSLNEGFPEVRYQNDNIKLSDNCDCKIRTMLSFPPLRAF